MSGQYVIVSSITYAYKGRDALERKGIRASIERAPANISDCGCHYAIKIGSASLDRAVQILSDAHVRVISTGGAGHDLS
jgi:hypothetical protein